MEAVQDPGLVDTISCTGGFSCGLDALFSPSHMLSLP